MSTFIQLCTKLRTECGVSGTNTSAVTPTPTGEWARMVGWIIDSWVEIQEEQPDWEWMRKDVVFNTVAQQSTYIPTQANVTDLGSWKERSFRAYLTSAGIGSEQLLGFKDYRVFRDYYLLSTRKTTYARPTEITVAPNKSLILGLIPNDVYTVSGEYYKTPVILAADADIPDMPVRFHNAIVYKAMMKYGAFEAASEVYDRGEKELKTMLNKLRMDQLPKMRRGGAVR